ncbi:hypothetical protein K469DRAFT_712596 [Zopfia rhizophila CBS 207.26]|uniref:Uncharacterized protein n=1 Tax=Zopfia rhizophila CBS 207.26 TaxID=1314779 RepID=A0A6A6EUJ9_9PEZI|nr:hypothetical protein K469DRAFT_712596 [Zopfia rhizophila CBS 207.26]
MKLSRLFVSFAILRNPRRYSAACSGEASPREIQIRPCRSRVALRASVPIIYCDKQLQVCWKLPPRVMDEDEISPAVYPANFPLDTSHHRPNLWEGRVERLLCHRFCTPRPFLTALQTSLTRRVRPGHLTKRRVSLTSNKESLI